MTNVSTLTITCPLCGSMMRDTSFREHFTTRHAQLSDRARALYREAAVMIARAELA